MKGCTEIMEKRDVTFFSCDKDIISNISEDQPLLLRTPTLHRNSSEMFMKEVEETTLSNLARHWDRTF